MQQEWYEKPKNWLDLIKIGDEPSEQEIEHLITRSELLETAILAFSYWEETAQLVKNYGSATKVVNT